MKPKILIADDHTLFNEGVRQLLEINYSIVGQVFDGKHVLLAIHEKTPDVVLLDINLPTINGFDLAVEIKRSFEKLKLIFLSMYSESKFVDQSKKLQVDGYLLKHSTKEELITGIESVLQGNIYYDPKLSQTTVNLHQDDYFVKQFSLTPREVEIIGLIKLGLNSAEIAQKLFLSEETVKSHRKNIHFKLGITKISELIHFANKNGI
jgi:DNA-binding NarL/FixJ family response regulator